MVIFHIIWKKNECSNYLIMDWKYDGNDFILVFISNWINWDFPLKNSSVLLILIISLNFRIYIREFILGIIVGNNFDKLSGIFLRNNYFEEK